MTARTRQMPPGIIVPRTTEEVHAKVPFPPEARPVRKRTMPETKKRRPIQSNVLAISRTVSRLVGFSLRKKTRTAMANPPVLRLDKESLLDDTED